MRIMDGFMNRHSGIKVILLIVLTLFLNFLVIVALVDETEKVSTMNAGETRVSTDGTDENDSRGIAHYVNLGQPIHYNYSSENGNQYVQASFTILTRSASTHQVIYKESRRIRYEILNLLSMQDQKNLLTPEGRENFLKATVKHLKTLFEKETDSDLIEEVLLTNFVMGEYSS